MTRKETKTFTPRPPYKVLEEIREYEFHGYKFFISIDHILGLVSLVEPSGGIKQWSFESRGLEFMNGWENILRGMLEVVREARCELEADLAERSKFPEDMIIKMSEKKV